ncbi:hypothetical protein ACI68E_003501 [Malassezia pachydermatis]|uniref:Peroxisomal membrane protein mpv17 n=1 Tax=Malassezia pachydermatis TaxID=77020 RepID=A0A0M9VNL3_9BASI|nr:peroxisomal membrane protein mpv17 [Malassezia pachydermatis]KOS13462.1 peroxisomal membrane protein mpv17 [Malassezia pachydermatis]
MTIGSFYRRSFERRPWLTLAITNGGLTLLADVLAQSVERITRTDLAPQPDWDYARSARFLTYGTAMGPFLAEWNKFLEFKFPIRSPSGAMLVGGLARRVMADQILMAPITMGLFVGAMGMMEGRLTYESLKEKFGELYVPALLANWKIWPFLQMFNFGVLPLRMRVPFAASCGVLWNLYLSILNRSKSSDVTA